MSVSLFPMGRKASPEHPGERDPVVATTLRPLRHNAPFLSKLDSPILSNKYTCFCNIHSILVQTKKSDTLKGMHKKGFTIFELVVVIGIIGLLSTAILASTSGSRERARDERRIAELHQVELALQAFYEVNGRFPTECAPDNASGFNCSGEGLPDWNLQGAPGHICSDCDEGINPILEQYAGKRFSDPLDVGDENGYGDEGNFYYYYNGYALCDYPDEWQAMLITHLENPPEDRPWDVCPTEEGEGGANYDDAYYIILGEGNLGE